MRKSVVMIIVAVTVALALPAFAELQNVVVGGQVRIRGNWWDVENGMNNLTFVEQRTRLNVRADFTDAVSAFIELDSYDVWGEDFRSSYITGVDSRASSREDVEVYQSYIEANEMWGTALKARIGRQEIKLGSGLLVGTNDKNALFRGVSFDGVRLSYATEQFSVDALYAKLAETSPMQEDGDVDLYGIYGSYLGVENITMDAYWLFVRDATNVKDGSLDLHTFGLRGAGTMGALDFEAEVAYQFAELEEYDCNNWMVNTEVGYTLDMDYTPRVFLGAAWFEGADDDEDVNASFDRLYSNWEYSLFLDNMANLTGVYIVRAGASAMPTESMKATLAVVYLVDDTEGTDCVDNNGDNDLGWEVDASLLYNYTEDLSFEVGYAHLFDGDGLDVDDSMDYAYFETKLSF